jgi:hypothetical protein
MLLESFPISGKPAISKTSSSQICLSSRAKPTVLDNLPSLYLFLIPPKPDFKLQGQRPRILLPYNIIQKSEKVKCKIEKTYSFYGGPFKFILIF